MAEPETKAPTPQEPAATNTSAPEPAKGDLYAYAAEKVSALSNYFWQQYYVHLATTLTLQQAEDLKNLAFLHYTNAKERYESLRDKTSKILSDAKLNADQKREQLSHVTQGAFTATQVKLAEWQKWSTEGLEKAQAWAVDKAQVLLKQAEEQYQHAVRQYEDIKRRTLENMGVSSAAISELMTVESLRNQAWAQYNQASERVHQLRDATAALLADTRLTAEQKREQIRTLAADLFKATQDKAGEWQVWASAPVEKAQQWVVEKAEEVRKQAEERYSQAVVRYEELKKRTLDTTSELSLQRADELRAQAFALYQQARERYESLKARLAKIFEDTQLNAEAKREKILQATTDAFHATSVRAEELKKWGSESVEKARQWALDTAHDLLKKAEEQYHQAIARYEELKKKTLEGAKALHTLTLQKAEELKVQANASLQQAKDRYETLKSATQKILDDAKLTAEQKREQLGQATSTAFQASQVKAEEWKKWGSESLEKARSLAIEKAEELTKQAEEQYNSALQRYEEMKKTSAPPATYTEQLTGAVGTAATYTYNWVGDVLSWALGKSASTTETKTPSQTPAS